MTYNSKWDNQGENWLFLTTVLDVCGRGQIPCDVRTTIYDSQAWKSSV